LQYAGLIDDEESKGIVEPVQHLEERKELFEPDR